MRGDSTSRSWIGSIPPLGWIGLGLVVLWFSWAVPLALEQRTLFLRDVLTGHLPYKSFGAEQLRQGEIPVFNDRWALGQPFRGNPNALPFYPGNLLYLALPFWSAYNLHFALHLLLALATMRSLARFLGLSRAGSLMAGITYAGSGWVMSCLTFYNLLTVAAWWPLVLLGAARGGRKGVAIGGFAVGLSVLGGEPLTAAIGFVPVLGLAVVRRGWLRGIGSCLAIGAIGALVALPQLVATLRVFDFTLRGGPGLPASQPGVRAFHPIRSLEFFLPFPFGIPGNLGLRGFWTFKALPSIPYFYSLYFGIVGFWLVLKSGRRWRGWAWLAIAALAVSWAGGQWPGLVENISAGLFRYAEKFLFWLALAVPLLAGLGLDRVVESQGRRDRSAWILAGLLGAVAVVLIVVRPALLGGIESGLPTGTSTEGTTQMIRTLEGVDAHVDIWVHGLILGGLILTCVGFASRRRNASALLVLQIAALLQLFPLAQTMALSALERPSPWMRYLETGDLVHNGFLSEVAWSDRPAYNLDPFTERNIAPIRAADLDSSFGVAAGLSYPLARDMDGIYSPLQAYLLQELRSLDWNTRVNWLRVLGVQYLVLLEDPNVEGIESVANEKRFGVDTGLFRVDNPAPPAWWPASVSVLADPLDQFRAVGSASEPLREAVSPIAVSHQGGAEVEVVESSGDRWRLTVNGEGGLLVIRQGYQPMFEATVDGEAVVTVPVNFCLLGVVVPPGSHEVIVAVARWPENLAALVSLLSFGLVGWLGWRR